MNLSTKNIHCDVTCAFDLSSGGVLKCGMKEKTEKGEAKIGTNQFF